MSQHHQDEHQEEHHHTHEHEHSHSMHHHHGGGNIKVAFFLNLSFTIIEIIGGIWTNSIAILSDALHDFGDSISLGVAWYLEKYSTKKPDSKFSFGYARFSVLGALINSVILIVGSLLILYKSIFRILTPESVNAKGMLFLALLGIAINGLAVLRLKKGSSLNEKVVYWHLMEDVLGWIVVLIASIVLMFVDIPILDPILSISITCYILYNVSKSLKEVLNVLLQGVPSHLSIDEIQNDIVREMGEVSPHHIHIWSLEGERNLISMHIVLKDDTNQEEIVRIKKGIRELMHKKGIEHVTLEIEFESEHCEAYECE